ncbi:MAG TPA: CinA family nicotinamide mononucleotide deamidase-related protein [Candidatus Hydrogenedentes bacterium]|nr:CinA family nicotinamide mononucleotide deamidase-related protein [Candidatus Hydrogenedentota bacterium]HOC72146.1 CinA family nicotinamide mononucleotide deamidase-related protein [Candidatus Hydrogenedentota bacterium]HOH49718.1 CinA family nicotinamide mononucleotide deamidase-related protein [Candidatus Hydrogenedentota bacterium]HQL93616.1 CinA family nicotinamide mononucleotide deamidase-related protein [Candidatus Hydrogenedentota bacterium]
MRAELMMIGTELLLGQIVDTNAAFMARALAEHGINVYFKTTVGDNVERISAALETALSRADVVLCSGGLGPTEDDITRECVAGVLGRALEYHPEIYAAIEARFAHMGRKITENNRRQAMAPRGAEIVENPHGTAPGLFVDDPKGVVVCMPGVPAELKPMLTERVIPRLCERFGITGTLRYRVLRVCGMGESRVDALMGDLILSGANPTVGLLAAVDGVTIRIAARAESPEAADALIAPVAAEAAARLGGIAFEDRGRPVEGEVDALLAERGWAIAVADAAAGGAAAARITAAGAACFAGGVVLPHGRAAAWAGHPAPVPPPPTEDLGDPLARTAVEMAGRLLLDYPVACALSLVADPAEKRTAGAVRTPEGWRLFGLGHYGSGATGQTRQAVIAWENVRRFLVGLPAE